MFKHLYGIAAFFALILLTGCDNAPKTPPSTAVVSSAAVQSSANPVKRSSSSAIAVVSSIASLSSSSSSSLFSSAQSSSAPSSASAVEIPANIAFLNNEMHTNYYWADTTPHIDLSQYNAEDEGKLFQDLRNPIDRWSFKITTHEYENFVNQVYYSFGYDYLSDDRGDIYVSYVDDYSPADEQGLRRGFKITQIDGATATMDALRQAPSPHTLTLVTPAGTINKTLQSKEYTSYGVYYNVYNHSNGKKVGYMSYKEFAENSLLGIEQAFGAFQQENIDELILDLRYNGGGSVDVASTLISVIKGGLDGSLQTTLRWNKQNSEKNVEYYFTTYDVSLFLNRLYIISTANTASASEMVISALKPYMDVIVVGTKSHGKPVGMLGKEYGEHLYFLINFSLYNANGYGDYFDGIPVTCAATDDIAHDGLEEESIAAAMYHIGTGECNNANVLGTSKYTSNWRYAPVFSEARSMSADSIRNVKIDPYLRSSLPR